MVIFLNEITTGMTANTNCVKSCVIDLLEFFYRNASLTFPFTVIDFNFKIDIFLGPELAPNTS
jgi:hypothetical protein